MIVQIVLVIAGSSIFSLGLVLLASAIGSSFTPPQRVTVPIEDAREHLPR